MAYDVWAYGTFSSRTNHRLELYFRRDQTDAPNNRSSYAWSLQAVRTSGQRSWIYDAQPWGVGVAGQGWSGSAGLPFDSNLVIIASGATGWCGHDGNGDLHVWGEAWMNASNFGNASCGNTLYSDRIARVPPAPTVQGYGVDQIGTTSVRYRFSSTGDGGSPITSWAYQYAENAAFTVGVVSGSSSGTSTITGLQPGKTYWIRSRGANAVGAGAWSQVLSFTTLSGAFVGRGNDFVGVEVLVGKNNAFVVATTFVGKPTDPANPAGPGSYVAAG